MNKETNKILGTLELLLESCPCINIPGHEDGGYIYPFVWETSKQGDFNALNLSLSKEWLKLTDDYVVLKNWQEMKYVISFDESYLGTEEQIHKSNIITTLSQLLSNNLQELESFVVKDSYDYPVGLLVGRTVDGDWISVCPTVYRETHIPQEQISRTQQNYALNIEEIEENTKKILSEIETIISEFGAINLESGDWYNYPRDHDYRMVYAAGKTKESAIEKILQVSGMLEISQFHSFYPDKQYFQEWEFVDELDKQDLMYQKYNQINQFLNQTFYNIMMYRFSFEIFEKIYIIGETKNGVSEAMPKAYRAGIYIKSDFVYNP